MRLAPYYLPLLPEFKTRAFKAATKRWMPRIKSALPPGTQTELETWTCFPTPQPRQSWQYKIYLCLDARSYWPGVHRLLRAMRHRPLMWKFYSHPGWYARPDKIVFYAPSAATLRGMVRRLRTAVRGLGFHELRHAVRTDVLGLEAPGRKGIWVGADPVFLGKASWRLYRAHCFAWAELNADYLSRLPGGSARWHERMNLSLTHEGPHGLAAAPTDIAYIRRYWRSIYRE